VVGVTVFFKADQFDFFIVAVDLLAADCIPIEAVKGRIS